MRKYLKDTKARMTDQPENLTYEERVARTRSRFVHSLPERLDAILDAIDVVPDADSRETQTRKAHRLFHDMAGNAAMLEMEGIEQSARQGLAIAERADIASHTFTDIEKNDLKAIVAQTRSIAAQLKELY